MSARTPFDATWLEYDDDRRVDVDVAGVRHIRHGKNARCGAGPLVTLLWPDDQIEFKCNLCWPAAVSSAENREGG